MYKFAACVYVVDSHHTLLVGWALIGCVGVVCFLSDEAKVLEQVIRDTEQISLDDETGVESESGETGEIGEAGDRGGGAPLVIEPGSAAAMLEDFITRFVGVVSVT